MNDPLGQVIPSTDDWAYSLQVLPSAFIRESSFTLKFTFEGSLLSPM